MKYRLGMILLACAMHVSSWAGSEFSVGQWQHLTFESKPVLNQHLFLYELARDKQFLAATMDTLITAGDMRIGALIKAVDVYKAAGVSENIHPLFASGSIPAMTDAAMNGKRLSQGDCTDVCQAVTDTAALYKEVFWPDHLEANQAWTQRLIDKLEQHGETIQTRLESLYQTNLVEKRHTVDVVFKPGERRGAWTSGRSPNTVINSSQPGYDGWQALEMVFHEVAHHRLTARQAPVSVAIGKAMDEAGVPDGKRIWHALMFYTVGEVVKETIVEAEPDYVAYADKHGLYSRRWAEYRSVMGRHWPGYLSGKLGLEESLHRVAQALVETGTDVTAQLRKRKSQWTVTFTLDKPAHELVFKRTPDRERANRWRSEQDGFTIVYADGAERIVRVDGKAFDTVTFDLDATYYSPPKEYAPFSPFTDGGMLVHSGRFFACVSHCEDRNAFRMQLQAEEEDVILLSGERFTGDVSWQDSDSGQILYVGRQRMKENPYFYTVIDPGLPQVVRKSMTEQLPLLVNYYADRLGDIEQKGMLFASFSPGDANEFQGGVLGNQVFAHFNGDKSIERADPISLFWFFSHEIAHRFQKTAAGAEDRNEAWIHEGGAEWLAYQSMKQLIPEASEDAERRLKRSYEQCLKGLQTTSFKRAAENGQHRLFYACGMHLNRVIDADLKANGHDYFSAWQAYQRAVDSGQKASFTTFWKSINSMLSAKLSKGLDSLCQSTPKQANRALMSLIETGG